MKHNIMTRVLAFVLCLAMLLPGFVLQASAAVTISKEPKSVAVEEGQEARVTVEAEGEFLTYRWYFKDAGAQNFSYTASFSGPSYYITMTPERDGRQVYCLISDKDGGSVKTDTVTLSLADSLTIASQPKDTYGAAGETVTVKFTADGVGVKYTWYYKDAGDSDFTAASEDTGNTYSVKMSSTVAGRQVYCVATDKYGNKVTSNTVTLTLAKYAKITSQPTSVTVKLGEKASAKVAATGDGLTYTWYYKDAGSSKFYKTDAFKTNTYSVSMTEERAGRQVYCVVTDKYGNKVTSDTATLKADIPVYISSQPVSVTVKKGDTATVKVTAVGEGLTYKWYYKNLNASKFALTTAFTGNTYSVEMSDSRNGRQVYCVITDKAGRTATSDVVTLSQAAPLVITQHPSNIGVPNGETAKVTVKASGEGLTYKWYIKNKGGSKFSLSSVKSSSYSCKMSDTTDGRQVYCVVTDKYGQTATSKTATLAMHNYAKITKDIASIHALIGKTASVTLGATGDDLVYEWYFKDAGSSKFYKTDSFDGPTYEVKLTGSRAGRQVYCVVTDKYGTSVQSKTATLNSIVIVQQPSNTSAHLNNTARTSIVVSAPKEVTYQWYLCQPGQTKYHASSINGNTYSMTMTEAASGRKVYCVLTDKLGNTLKSDVITMTLDTTAKITRHPVSEVVVENNTQITLNVTAIGRGLTYQWYRLPAGGTYQPITNATSAEYTTTLKTANNGDTIYCKVTDDQGNSVNSSVTNIVVGVFAKITKNPADDYALLGDTVSASVTAVGDGLKYQWYVQEAGKTEAVKSTVVTATYSITMTEEAAGSKIYCVVTDQYGNEVTSETATLYCADAIVFTKQPASVQPNAGDSVTLTVEVDKGTAPYSYQWQTFDGTNWVDLTGATKSSLAIDVTSAVLVDEPQFRCVVTDSHDIANVSDVATITPKPLKVGAEPADVLAKPNRTVTFKAVAADGCSEYTYRWYYKSVDKTTFTAIPGTWDYTSGEKTDTLSFNVTKDNIDDEYVFRCKITDKGGNVVNTQEAKLVDNRLKISKNPSCRETAVGDQVNLKVTAANGVAPLTYQWYYKNDNMTDYVALDSTDVTFSGYDTDTLTFTANAKTFSLHWTFKCTVTDADGDKVNTVSVKIPQKIEEP